MNIWSTVKRGRGFLKIYFFAPRVIIAKGRVALRVRYGFLLPRDAVFLNYKISAFVYYNVLKEI